MPSRKKSSRAAVEAEMPSSGRLLSFAALLVAAMAFLSACNTMRGVGEDVGAAGDTLGGTAEEVEEEM